MTQTVKPDFNAEVFLSLPQDSQRKVECIYQIADILHVNNVPKIKPKDFDQLYDRPVHELEDIVGNVQAQLRYTDLEGE